MENYLKKFSKSTDKMQTHLSMNGGKYNIPINEVDNLYKKYYKHVILENEKISLVEKIHGQNFKFFIDIDNLKDLKINNVVCSIDDSICNITGKYHESIVLKRKTDEKYHIVWQGLIVDKHKSLDIIRNINDENVKNILDLSVYNLGLRMMKSLKKNEPDSEYIIYDILKSCFIENPTFEDFLKTCIRINQEEDNKQDITILPHPINDNENNINLEDENKIKFIISSLSEDIIDKNALIKIKLKDNYFYITFTTDKYICPFYTKKHKRISCPLYLKISKNFTSHFLMCFNEECKFKKYDGTKITFDNEEIETKPLEEHIKLFRNALSATHFDVSALVHELLQNKYKADSIKDISWYEFNGVRYEKNLNIHLEIPTVLFPYYNYMFKNELLQSSEYTRFKNLNDMLKDSAFKNNILTQIAILGKIKDPKFYENLNTKTHLIGFNDVVYDFEKQSIRQGYSTDYITFNTKHDYIEYDENNENIIEIFDFLQKIIPDKDVLDFILKVFGKSLIGVPNEKFYIFTGLSGANGKSTLINFLELALGEYITSADVSLLTLKRNSSSSPSPDIIRLKGKRIITFQEPENDDKLKTGILKQFSGGDSVIARELYKPPIEFKIQGTMFLCCNTLPSISSNDGGTWRRIRVVEFNSRFCDNPTKKNEYKIDPDIKNKMKKWAPYFMSMLIHYCNLQNKHGIKEPESVMVSTCNYKNENDQYVNFFEKYKPSDDNIETGKYLYSSFQNWWSDNNTTTKMPSFNIFLKALKIQFGNEITSNGIKGWKISCV